MTKHVSRGFRAFCDPVTKKSKLDPSDQIRIGNMNKGFNRFGLLLASRLFGDVNQVCSPFSITLSLAMLLPGTRGVTQKEIERTLALDRPIPAMCDLFEKIFDDMANNREKNIELTNGIFTSDEIEIKTGYMERLKKSFNAEVQKYPLSDPDKAAMQINRWVAEKTCGKFPNVVSPEMMDPSTLLLVINTLYLFAAWETPFKPELTQIAPFYLHPHLDDKTVDVPMMNDVGWCSAFRDKAHTFTSVVLKLSHELSFQVILPEPGKYHEVCNNLPDLLQNQEKIDVQRIELSLPRFKIESGFALMDTLAAFGLMAVFEKNSDFSGLTTSSPIWIGEIIQKAKLSIDEQGVEAAAFTSTRISGTGPPPPPVPFIVNRPFLFLIQDHVSDAILFAGGVTNPKNFQ